MFEVVPVMMATGIRSDEIKKLSGMVVIVVRSVDGSCESVQEW